MEALSISERVERLERLHGIAVPAICPDPTGEGSAWQGEAARSVPVGWVDVAKTHYGRADMSKALDFHGIVIAPDPSIPWGEMYEAIILEEARDGDEFFNDGWNISGDIRYMPSWLRASVPWRRRKSPAEPAPGSDAEHPPLGYRLEPVGGKRAPGHIFWSEDRQSWIVGGDSLFGIEIDSRFSAPIANPIPANEGDSQKAGLSDKIAESVVQDLQQACYDCVQLRATVERLTSELDTTKRLLAESLVERDRLKNLHDARKVRIDGFRDVLSEKLGDLV